MLTMADYAKQPREQRMQHLTHTGDELAAAIKGQSDAVLSRRPDAKNWAAKEVICHLRDTEEVFGGRLEQIANDAGGALAAFRRRRAETLETFGKLTPAQWEKGTLDGFLSVMAWHDDNHLDQLTRARQGRA